MSVISAARTASEIVLSDLAESNLEALRKWLRRDAEAFDWSPYFDHVVQTLEGKGEEEAREREERLREIAKDVAYCNIEEDPPIRTTCPGLYDIVIDGALTLSSGSRSKEMFGALLLQRCVAEMKLSKNSTTNHIPGSSSLLQRCDLLD